MLAEGAIATMSQSDTYILPTLCMQVSFLLTFCCIRMKSKIQAKGQGSSSGARVPKTSLKDIAASTLEQIERGSYNVEGRTYDLTRCVQEMKNGTVFYPADSDLYGWRANSPSDDDVPDRKVVRITVTECSTLSGARTLDSEVNSGDGAVGERKKIGVLNFASAKNPGGGFLTGAQAQVRVFFYYF